MKQKHDLDCDAGEMSTRWEGKLRETSLFRGLGDYREGRRESQDNSAGGRGKDPFLSLSRLRLGAGGPVQPAGSPGRSLESWA